MVFFGCGKGADAHAFAVDALSFLKAGRLHLYQVCHQVLCTGCGAGIVPQLHRQPALHLGHSHGFMVNFTGCGHLVGCCTHDIQRFLRKACNHRAVVFIGNKRCHLPVCQRDILCQDVVDAAGDQAHRSALDDVQVGNDKGRGFHGNGLFLAVEDHRADAGGKAVRTGKCRDCHKGDTKLVCGVAAEVHDGACTEGDQHLRGLEFGHHILNQDIFRTQPLCRQDDFLISLDMFPFSQGIDVAVVDDRAALVSESDGSNILLKSAERVVFHNDHFSLQLMCSAAAAFSNILGTVHNHKADISSSTVTNFCCREPGEICFFWVEHTSNEGKSQGLQEAFALAEPEGKCYNTVTA